MSSPTQDRSHEGHTYLHPMPPAIAMPWTPSRASSPHNCTRIAVIWTTRLGCAILAPPAGPARGSSKWFATVRCMFSKLRIAMTLLGAGLILALPTQAVANPVPDPRGDVVNPGERDTADYDIVLARSVTRGDKLIYMVKVAGTPEVGDDHTVFGTGIQIEINTEGSRPGDCHRSSRDPLGRAEYILDTHGNPSLVDCRASGIPELKMIQVRKRPGAFEPGSSSVPEYQTRDSPPVTDSRGCRGYIRLCRADRGCSCGSHPAGCPRY